MLPLQCGIEVERTRCNVYRTLRYVFSIEENEMFPWLNISIKTGSKLIPTLLFEMGGILFVLLGKSVSS